MPQQVTFGAGDIDQPAQPQVNFTESDIEPTPGFTERLTRPLLGVSGPREALRNIGETGRLLIHDPKQLSRGAGMFGTAVLEGIAKEAANLVRIGTLPGLVSDIVRRQPSPSASEVLAPIGGREVRTGIQDVRNKNYAGAAGSFAAAGLEALPALPKLSSVAGRAATAAEEWSRPAELASGEHFPATPAIKQPEGLLPGVERVVGGTLGGGKLREARAAEQTEGARIMRRIIQTASDNAGAKPGPLPKSPAAAGELAGRAIRAEGSLLHQDLETAMASPQATQPIANQLRLFARIELQRHDSQALLSRPELAGRVLRNLEQMRSTTLNRPVPNAYQIFRDTYSDLGALKRSGRLSPNEGRIVGEMQDRLDAAVRKALRQTDPTGALTRKYGRAMALTRQGYAMDELADALKSATSGTPEQVQTTAGAKTRPQSISGSKLVKALNELADVPPPLPGQTAKTSRLAQAIPRAADARTIRQIAELLSRGEAAGGESTAAKFGLLGAVRAGGGALFGAPFGHPVMGAIAGVVLPELGSYTFARLMTMQRGPELLAAFLRAAPRSALEGQLLNRIEKMTSEDQPDQPSTDTTPPLPTPQSNARP